MVNFFIDRPVFAWVVAIVIMLAGTLSITQLPIEQYPPIAPASVTVSGTFPGASARTVENTVTQVIEQKMNGIDYLRYMSSTSDSSGTGTVTLTFEPEADPDIAQVQVQNKLQSALPLLPQEVQQQGVTVAKSARNFLMVIAFISTDGQIDETEIADYVASNIQDPVSRVNGVGEIQRFGPQHAMRIWIDPQKLQSYSISISDIATAISAQNAEVSAGQLGARPAVEGQQLNATVTAQTRLETPAQFEDILLRVNEDGSQVRLKDVSRVELGAENYQTIGRYNGDPAAGIAVRLASGANALDTAEAVRAKIAELEPFFPEGLKAVIPYDTTPFVRLSINEVIKTLAEAIVLVILVMYLFLQNIRATFIPTVAVPVVLLGTFGILAAFGFTINTLTMFGMVLAIGLLVDDAIVVVENVERVMSEEGLSPREATRKSMGQITGALVGIGLVLSAVLIPMAFFSGSTGAIYRQFSLTIVSAMALSVIVALVLTPALCATILKPVKNHGEEKRGFFGWFNRMFDRSGRSYDSGVRRFLAGPVRYMVIYGVIVVILGALFLRLPTSFLPEEDQGFMMTLVTTPAGASAERTRESMKLVENYFLEQEKDSVQGLFSVVGFNFAGAGQNSAMAFINLKPFDERGTDETSAFSVAQRAMGFFDAMKDAMAFAIIPPAITELGTASGFDMQLIDRAGIGHEKLMQARNQLLGLAAQSSKLTGVRPNGLDDMPEFRVDVDQEKASALGLALSDINNTLSAAWGSTYVNDFIDQGRVKKVYLQADAPFRMLPEDIYKLHVRNANGEMVPFSAFAKTHWTYGSPRLERFNGSASRQIQGSAAPGVSSGDAMAEMENLMEKLPEGVGHEWTGLSYEERQAGAQAPALYALSLLFVFLCLAALYESWSIPISVMLVVPLGVLGAVLAATMTGLSNDVYFQVGLLVTIGLAAKNAILIVEFAKSLYERGESLADAASHAAQLRLRPIIMTSLAFTLGVLPLAIASGPGSGSQNAIGIGVMGGMISATILAIFFVPLFFVVVQRFAPKQAAPASMQETEID
ncbi:efflux RND transporter permease subunit [Parvibaculum sp.]|uniref:efflux RND transporter permease subunit n=1 Tax=Parvibaculum sp. TaxID=2024848 RepID=UPI000C3C21D3|nr:efflux RND transporter permease subunit [Parvibaculum sp.]MAM93408.1 hydrophobe/amphiphile efflux-1 family RND transporter [Parvibaculum sp.]|tara:strand:- start:932 stop:4066 length:3135 start_codon:yes stop_codon:yes gene_type:complete